MIRIRLRTMMILVAVAAGMIAAAIGPVRRWYDGRLWHFQHVELYRQLESKIMRAFARDQRLAKDRDAIRARWMSSDDFARKSEVQKEAEIDKLIKMYFDKNKRRLEITASFATGPRKAERCAIWGTCEEYREYLKSRARAWARPARPKSLE